MNGTTKSKTPHMHMMMCFGTACLSSGAERVKTALEEQLEVQGMADEVSVIETGCNGFCAGGPLMVVYPGGVFYNKVTPEDTAEIVAEHVIKGRPVERLMYQHPTTQARIPLFKDIPFFARQNLRVLRNKGRIAAESIDEYISPATAMPALAKALTEMTPEGIVDEIMKSGLRGRGGAGFPTGLKWEFAAKAPGDKKYILCNADEGDPGAFMDRSILESDPHAVLEGMMIGARAIGADEGYIYCRAEYPLALERLGIAIQALPRVRPAGREHPGHRLQLRHPHRPGLGRLRLRRGDGAHDLHRGQARRAAARGRRSRPRRACGTSPRCSTTWRRWPPSPAIIREGRRLVPHRRHREEPRHQDLRPLGQGQQRRPGGSRHGHPPGRHHLRHRRRHPRRQASSRPPSWAVPPAAPSRGST